MVAASPLSAPTMRANHPSTRLDVRGVNLVGHLLPIAHLSHASLARIGRNRPDWQEYDPVVPAGDTGTGPRTGLSSIPV